MKPAYSNYLPDCEVSQSTIFQTLHEFANEFQQVPRVSPALKEKFKGASESDQFDISLEGACDLTNLLTLAEKELSGSLYLQLKTRVLRSLIFQRMNSMPNSGR